MTNLAKLPVYTETPEPEANHAAALVTAVVLKPINKRARGLSREDQQIVITLHELKYELECLHNRYDQTTEPLLLDSITYEIKALNTKYRYYLHLCKEKGIIGSMGHQLEE